MDGCGHSKSVHHIVMSTSPCQHTEKMQNEKNHLLCNISHVLHRYISHMFCTDADCSSGKKCTCPRNGLTCIDICACNGFECGNSSHIIEAEGDDDL